MLATTVIQFIEQSELATSLRNSLWLYPLINAGHILGIGLIIGSILPLDLKILGFWRKIPIVFFENVLQRTAIAGLILAIISGGLLFITNPQNYLDSDVFITKIILLALALLNAFSFTYSAHWQQSLQNNTVTPRIKIQALASVLLWLAILLAGRLIAYR